MASPLLRLARQSGVYALGNAAIKAGGLLLLWLYLDPALLAQAEYGRLILIETAASLAVVVAGLGLAHGLLKYATDPAFADDRDALGFTTLVVTAGLAAALWAVVALLAAPLAGVLLDDTARAPLVRLAGAYAALKVVATVPYMAMRVEERAGWYVAGLVVEFAVLVGGVYYFLAVERMGLDGVLIGYVLSAGATAVLLSVGLLARSRWQFRRGLVGPLFRFGVPLTFASLATVLLNTGDRFLLDGFVGAEAVAVYGLAQKFGGLVNMLFVQSFSMAFAVLGLKALGSLSGDGGEVGNLHRRTFRHYAVLTGWGVLGVSLLAFDVTEVVSPNPAYLDADPLVLPIALGFMAYGVYIIMMNVLYATAQTKRIAGNVLGAALLNLALNAALIPLLGAMGAALATFAAYAALAAVTTWQARRAVAITFPWSALGAAVLVVAGLWALGQPSLGWTQPVRLAWRLGLLVLYPPLVLAAGVYSRDELRIAWAAVRGYVRR
ncbi:MAG: polysaccharide biosynthesis C-terminal domain-containing protein [Rhodothermales bacterium]